MSVIGDLMLRVVADLTGFEAQVTKEGTTAGNAAADKIGSSMGQRMSKGLTKGMALAGAGAGLLFSVAAKGANDLTNAMATFQAETGATQEELASARKSVLELSKSNIQSFDQIAAAQAALRTDLGLTQKEAEAATGAFLDFANATGQDAAEGVRALDDILDNWGLTAADAQGIMDKLIVSHQKWGGSITDNQKTLAKLAPAMQAANFQIDDGIALLGLFGAKGLDSERAAAAFSKALTKVKSPEELKILIADIQNTVDPFERAQKAAALFGAKAGAQLANALGGANLDDYTVSMDEAAGATERASDAIKNTPFNQLKMALSAIAAPAIEAGQSFGPLILALSQLGGGKLLASVLSGLGGIAGALSSKLVPVFSKLGVKIAAQLGIGLASRAATEAITNGAATGLSAGLEGGITAAVKSAGVKGALIKGIGMLAAFAPPILIGLALAPVAQEQHDATLKQAEELTRDAVNAGNQAGIEQQRRNLNAMKHAAYVTGDQTAMAFIDGQLKALDAGKPAVAAATADIPDAAASGMAAGEPTVTAAALKMVSGVPGTLASMQKLVAEAGKGTPRAFADGVAKSRGIVADAISTFKNALANEMSPAKERARLLGELAGKELAKGLKSKDPVVKQAAIDAREAIIKRLDELVPKNGKIGKKAGAELAKALKSKDPTIRAAAQKLKATIEGRLNATKAREAGQKAGRNVAGGLRSQSGPVAAAARALGIKLANAVINGVRYVAGKHEEGSGTRGGRAAGGPVRAGVPYWVNENTPRSELMVPSTAGHILTHDDAMRAASASLGGGDSLTINVPVQGALPVRTIRDLATEMKRVADAGILRPRTVPPMYKRREATTT